MSDVRNRAPTRKTLLLTGASGFVGSRAVETLAATFDVVATVRGDGARPDRKVPGVEWLELDLSAPMRRWSLPEKVDAILHLAVSRRHREFPSSAREQFTVNVASTAELLDYALSAGASRFVLASTGSVYGASQQPGAESHAVFPADYYSATKAAAEKLLAPYDQHFGSCALRLYFPYGPGQKGRLLPSLVDRVAAGQPIQLQGDDGMVIAPTFVDDVVDVLGQALREDWTGPVNVAGAEALSLRDIGLRIAAVIGREARFERVDGAAPHLVPDLGRLAERVDLTRFVPFDEGIRRTIEARSEQAP